MFLSGFLFLQRPEEQDIRDAGQGDRYQAGEAESLSRLFGTYGTVFYIAVLTGSRSRGCSSIADPRAEQPGRDV